MSKPSKRTQAWQRTKTFLSTIGEPPTAEYDRRQAALALEESQGDAKGLLEKDGDEKVGIRNGREAFGAVNYGPYQQGGPWTAGGRI